jgi:AAA domain
VNTDALITDLAAMAEAARAEARESRGGRRSWRPVDLADVLDGRYQRPQPTVGARDDGVGLFYPGRSHTASGESKSAKTWLLLAAAKHELHKGNGVVFLDFEDDEGGVVGRQLTIGTDKAAIRERFAYLRPEESIEALGNRDDLAQVLGDLRPTLVILDGVTEAMSLHGLEMKDNTDVARFGQLLPRWIADQGPATVALDHVVKDKEGRGRYSIGGVHKLNGLNGAAYLLENRTPFGIGVTGKSTVRIAKDRPGQLRRHALPSGSGLPWFGDLVLISHSEAVADVALAAPIERTDETFRPTTVMAKIAKLLQEKGPQSQRTILALVGGKRDTAILALRTLIAEGYVSDKTPHALLKPYQPSGSSSAGDGDPVLSVQAAPALFDDTDV